MDLTSFKNHLLINGSSEASAETHCSKVASFFRQYEIFNQENLNSFLASKIDKWCGNSFNLSINAFNHYAKFLKVEIEIPKYHKSEQRIMEYLSEKDFYDIISKIPLIFKNSHKTQALAILMFSTGLRPKEVIQLKRENFNFETKEILISNTKTHRDRPVAMSNVLCDMLPAIFSQEAEQTNFLNIKHHHLTYIFQRLNEMMGLKIKLTPYSMRRSYCHNLISKGVKLTSLQRSLGHSSISTTLRYLDVSNSDAMDEIRTILNKKRKNKRRK